jgi:hypothetical protein
VRISSSSVAPAAGSPSRSAAVPLSTRERFETDGLLLHARLEAFEEHVGIVTGRPAGNGHECCRFELPPQELVCHGVEGFAASAPDAQRPRALGQRMETEGRRRDQAERAERTDRQFRKVEAGHVLDDLSAAANALAVGPDQRHADDQVAQAAEAGAARPEAVRGHEAAQRREFRIRGVQRQALTVRGEVFLQRCERDPSLDLDDHVRGRVLHDAREPRRLHEHVDPGRRITEAELRAAPEKGNRRPAARRLAEHVGRFGQVRRHDDRFGGRSAHGVAPHADVAHIEH